MVNQEHMQRWIDALRGGEYTQITGWLETSEGNCVFGVACREAIKAGVDVECRLGGHYSGTEVVTVFDGTVIGMPNKVMEWLGMRDNEPILLSTGAAAVYANDAGVSFADIADGLYERYLKEPTDG